MSYELVFLCSLDIGLQINIIITCFALNHSYRLYGKKNRHVLNLHPYLSRMTPLMKKEIEIEMLMHPSANDILTVLVSGDVTALK